jgi:antirestriction protein ArdC
VRKGEKGWPVIFWRWFDRDEAADDAAGEQRGRRRAPVIRYYTVFNAEQCDGLEVPPVEVPTFTPIAAAARILHAMPDPPAIEHDGVPYYQPSTDVVHLPPPERFDPPEEYYSTAFHELVHATGHEKRLARKGVMDPKRFGDHAYSREELVAETGAAFLCAHAGIEQRTLDNSAAYIGSWISVLRGDSRLVVEAAAAAQRATDWILGSRQPTQDVD